MALVDTLRYWLTYRSKTVLFAFIALAVVIVIMLGLTEATLGNISEDLRLDMTDVALITVQLFAIIDPIGALPIYIMYDQAAGPEQGGKLARTITVAVLSLLLFFVFLGPVMLQILRISVSSFQLGGGILLIVLAVDMLGEGARTKSLEPDEAAIVPLASPLLVGPGTMATIIVLEGTRPLINLLFSVVLTTVLVALILRFSSAIGRTLGKNGLRAVSRLFSLVLAAIAAQMIHDALLAWGLIGS
jgi:multiple antibiotic resistance protein